MFILSNNNFWHSDSNKIKVHVSLKSRVNDMIWMPFCCIMTDSAQAPRSQPFIQKYKMRTQVTQFRNHRSFLLKS